LQFGLNQYRLSKAVVAHGPLCKPPPYFKFISQGAEEDGQWDEMDDDPNRESGTVKWFNVTKGFGFVTRDQGDDVFVHFRSIRGKGHRSLLEGQRVRFSVTESDKGIQAEDVSIVG
jgi:CspA family cold shock protein